jgi:Histidine kinase-like ATPase domain
MTVGNKPATRLVSQGFPVIRAWSDSYPAAPEQVRHARRGLASFLDGSPWAGDAVTCLSELVTNSIEHSNSRAPGGLVTVRATLAAGRLRVEVEDQGGTWHQPATRADGPRGRGLAIVAALSGGWGKTGDGTRSRTVWFEMSAGSLTQVPRRPFMNHRMRRPRRTWRGSSQTGTSPMGWAGSGTPGSVTPSRRSWPRAKTPRTCATRFSARSARPNRPAGSRGPCDHP